MNVIIGDDQYISGHKGIETDQITISFGGCIYNVEESDKGLSVRKTAGNLSHINIEPSSSNRVILK